MVLIIFSETSHKINLKIVLTGGAKCGNVFLRLVLANHKRAKKLPANIRRSG